MKNKTKSFMLVSLLLLASNSISAESYSKIKTYMFNKNLNTVSHIKRDRK